MKDFAGKAAFITGGAGGIGLAMARAFGQRGMKVAIADVEAETCARAVEALRRENIEAIGTACDVSDREALAEAANRTFAEFGKVHVLCNNAGVSRAGPIEAIAASDWDWVIGVNLKPHSRLAVVPAAHEGAWRGRPYRQHRLDQWCRRRAARGSL